MIAMNSYWTKHPPLHIMVQGYFGIKPTSISKASIKKEEENPELDLQEFTDMFFMAGGSTA